MYTPPTPTRRNSTVSSRRRRRCVLGLTFKKILSDFCNLRFLNVAYIYLRNITKSHEFMQFVYSLFASENEHHVDENKEDKDGGSFSVSRFTRLWSFALLWRQANRCMSTCLCSSSNNVIILKSRAGCDLPAEVWSPRNYRMIKYTATYPNGLPIQVVTGPPARNWLSTDSVGSYFRRYTKLIVHVLQSPMAVTATKTIRLTRPSMTE